MITILYQGYLRGDGKHAATKIKGAKLLAWQTVRRDDSIVGVLADDTIMVDVDTKAQAYQLQNILEAQGVAFSAIETHHGMHFYFTGYELTSNHIGWYTPIGIKADFKLGIKSTADPLKIDGVMRPWVVKAAKQDPLPKWLVPINNHDNYIETLSTGERNQKLFNYILTLQKADLSRDEIRQTVHIINDFILDKSLPKREIDTILRDEAFLKETFYSKKGAFLHDKFSKFLINEHHIIQIYGVLHVYKDGVYSDDQADVERVMLQHIPGLTRARRLEVLSYLQLKAPPKQPAPVKYVAVQNGLFNLDTWQLQEFDPSIIVKNKIPVKYVPDAYYEITDRTLNKITVGNQQLRKVLDEIFGYVLLRRNELGKAFILTGDGSNGKSSYLKLVKAFVGADNTTSLDLKELGQRFKSAQLLGKLANIGDDISNEYIKDNSEFKKLVTGETLNVERKGKDPFDFNNYAKLIFSANQMPRINDSSHGLTRRLMFIPFNATFTPDDADYDPFINDKLLSEQSLQYVLQLALVGLKRLLKRHQFTSAQAVEDKAKEYEELNNPIIMYLRAERPKLDNELVKDCYVEYSMWCNDNGFRAMAQRSFTREITLREKLTTKTRRVKGERKQIFVMDT